MPLLTASRTAIAALRDDSKNVDQVDLKALLTGLLNAVKDQLATTTVVVTDSGSGNAVISGQIQDADGASIAARGRVLVSLHSAATNAAIDAGTATAGTNTALTPLTADATFIVDTHTNGAWSINFDTASNPASIFARASVIPVVLGSSAVA